MSKPLTNNELLVLQENLDLFGSPEDIPAPKTKKNSPKTRKRTAPTQKGRNSKSNSIVSQTSESTTKATPATADMLNALAEVESQEIKEVQETTVPATPLKEPSTKEQPTPTIKTATESSIFSTSIFETPTPEAPIEEHDSASSPEKYLAVRAASSTAAKDLLENDGAHVINYALEKRDPALRNVSESLLDLGMEYRINNQTIHWLLIEDELSVEDHLSKPYVEIAFSSNWFEKEKERIRQLRGIAYLDACLEIAQKLH